MSKPRPDDPGATFGPSAFCLGAGSGAYLAVDWALMTEINPIAPSGRYMGLANIANRIAGPVGLLMAGSVMDAFYDAGEIELGPRVAVGLRVFALAAASVILIGVHPRRDPRIPEAVGVAARPGRLAKDSWISRVSSGVRRHRLAVRPGAYLLAAWLRLRLSPGPPWACDIARVRNDRTIGRSKRIRAVSGLIQGVIGLWRACWSPGCHARLGRSEARSGRAVALEHLDVPSLRTLADPSVR